MSFNLKKKRKKKDKSSFTWCKSSDGSPGLVPLLPLSSCFISLVSSQQAEISKWKNRAINLKVKNKADLERPSSPCTPTKRGFLIPSDSTDLSPPPKFLVSPKRLLASPLKVLDSPKSSFFDVEGTSERLSRNRPKQFFDNSSLGILPGEVYLRCNLNYVEHMLHYFKSCGLFVFARGVLWSWNS